MFENICFKRDYFEFRGFCFEKDFVVFVELGWGRRMER